MTEQRDDTLMSIGAVSQATGIPKETLRTWERRYGFPSPERSSTGHRRYSSRVIEPLKLIHVALERGHRPAQIIGQDAEALRALLDLTSREATPQASLIPALAALSLEPLAAAASALDGPASDSSPLDEGATVARWMTLLVKLDREQLHKELEHSWFGLGPKRFLCELVGPFLAEIGQAWHEGRIAVFHEQFASHELRQFMTSQWRPISDHAHGPHVLLATLPGEYHVLGLHMAACIMAMSGYRLHFMGADLPPQAIAQAAEQLQASYVLVSISAAANPTATRRHIDTLRALLPEPIHIITGGQGARPRQDLEGVTSLQTLGELEAWAKGRYAPSAR